MKHIHKVLILVLGLTIISCSDDDNSVYSDNTLGWIQFDDNETNINVDSNSEGLLELPVKIEVPVTNEGLKIAYELVPVAGANPNTIFTNNGLLDVESGVYGIANPKSPTINFNLAEVKNITQTMVFDLVLKSSGNSKVKLGIANSNRPIKNRITICPIIFSQTYTGNAYSDDINLPLGTAPSYTTKFTPVNGATNVWTLDTTWGPDFVSFLTGNQVPPGSFPYSSTLTLNDDFTVTVIGDDQFTPGGQGTFDPCTNTFVLSLTQELFTEAFTVDVILNN